MNKFNLKTLTIRGLLYLVLLSTTIGCDGGLFGTGDGGDIVVPPSGTAPQTDLENGEGDNPGVTDPAAPSAQPDPPGNPVDTISGQVFQNQLVTGNNELALITLINASTQPLNMIGDISSTPLLNTALLSGFTSEHIELSDNNSPLNIINSDTLQALFEFSSLALDPSTVSTFIAFDAPATADSTDSSYGLNIIALRTLTSSTDANVATVRLVQANQLGGTDTVATMTLLPAGSNPGSGEVIFNNVSLSDAAQSEYRDVNAGTYQLQDSLARFEPVSISIEASTVYTLVITGTVDPVLIIEQDSDVVLQPDFN